MKTEINPFRECFQGVRSRTAISIICLALLLAWAVPASAGEYHVDCVNGSDDSPGSREKPFKTITRASRVLKPGDKAIIHPGIYHEQVMGGTSGSKDSPIVYEGVDRDKVILQGSVALKDWRQQGNAWVRRGLKPITLVNAFVLVDEKHMLKKVDKPTNLPPGSFFVDPLGIYLIRLMNDANPNTDHKVEVYELDFAFNSGDRWGGTAKNWITMRNMTIEKYGAYGISSDVTKPFDNTNWVLNNLDIRLNHQAGIFACGDDWVVQNCVFQKNLVHGCQINGARVRFEKNVCSENECFGSSGYGGAGLLIGPDKTANSCLVISNDFSHNGDAVNGFGCGLYLEGRSFGNTITSNNINGNTHCGIGFYGSSRNLVINNVISNTGSERRQDNIAAFLVGHSYEGSPTQSKDNLIAHNTVWKCPTPIQVYKPTETILSSEQNLFVNNIFAEYLFITPIHKNFGVETKNNAWFQARLDLKLTKENLKGMLDENLASSHETTKFRGKNPEFTAPDKFDFRLKKGSPLIDSGQELKEVSSDKDGAKRPCGKAPDMGAYENCN